MGKSESIKDKQAADKAFREFMDQLEQESRVEEERIFERVSALATEHYGANGWKHARLFGNRQSDYQNYSDWSLDRVNNIITSIATALSAKNYPSDNVPGSEQASPGAIDTAKEFAGAFMGDYTLAIQRVTAMLTAILSQFASSSSAKRTDVLRDMPLSGGLHLFFGCSGSVYQRQDFFTNQFIGSFQIVFEAHVSADEARAIGLQQILSTTELELAILNEQIILVRQIQAEELSKILKSNPALYVPTKASYDVILDSLKLDRAKVVEQYDKYKTVLETVDRLFARLDLTEFERPSLHSSPIHVDELFAGAWEREVARRYVREKLAA